jgi:flagellar biosynthesis protein FlhG
MTRTITITSGKGGVGKTNISLNLALELARLGHSTCLFDADFGTANVNILLGISPRFDIKDVMLAGKGLAEIIIPEAKNLDLLPGSSGVEAMANLTTGQRQELLDALSTMQDYDFLIIDTAAGISKNVISFCLASSEVVLVITHEPTSLTDAYALLKVLAANGYTGTARVVVNRCHDSSHARITFATFKNAVLKHLNMKVAALGLVLEDEAMMEAIRRQEPFLRAFPDSQAAKCFHMLASRLVENKDGVLGADLGTFWRTTLEVMTGHLAIPKAPRQEVPPPASLALQPGTSSPPDQVVAELRLLRQTLEAIAAKIGNPPAPPPNHHPQPTGPVVSLDLSELLDSRQGSAETG